MVTVGFLVEGDTEKKLVESDEFREWARNTCGFTVVDPVVVAGGPLTPERVRDLTENLLLEVHPDKVVVLIDLDPDEDVPCITERKARVGDAKINLVLVANSSIESWFMADTQAMRSWLGDTHFIEEKPELPVPTPWERLKKLRTADGRGPGATKVIFARKFIRDHGFDLSRAAAHPACPSAAYTVNKLKSLSES